MNVTLILLDLRLTICLTSLNGYSIAMISRKNVLKNQSCIRFIGLSNDVVRGTLSDILLRNV